MDQLNRNEEAREIEEALLVREFVAADLEVKGRTVDVRVVPFEEVATVSDPPYDRTYREQWMPGVFDHQLKAANHIQARYGHSPHIIDVVGRGISLRHESDGYHISTKIFETPGGDTALELLRDGSLPSVSLEAQPRPNGSRRSADGIVKRFKANLTGFAFCRQGAFVGAQVLAIREAMIVDEIDEDLLPVDIDPERVERLRAQGIVLPSRYQAHPADTGTPAEAGTPDDDGTRQTEVTTSSEE
jgi:HK97 family phage prohead protease